MASLPRSQYVLWKGSREVEASRDEFPCLYPAASLSIIESLPSLSSSACSPNSVFSQPNLLSLVLAITHGFGAGEIK